MKKIFLIALVLVLSNINHSTAIAQEEEKKSNLFLIHEDVVKPSMVSQYMETSKEFVKLMEDENADVPPFWASMTSDLYFYYLTPLENYSALDKDNEKWGAAIEKMGQEKFDAVMDKYKGTYLHHRNFLMRRSNMYSYKPENPRLKDDEIKFLRWGFYYLEEGNEEKVEQLVKKYHELFSSKKVPNGYNLYFSDIGQPLSLMVVVEYAKSAADYYAEEEKTSELLGDDVMPLREEFLKLVKKFEFKQGWPRPDLGYQKDKM